MIDETSRHINKAFHSQSVGHGMRHDEIPVKELCCCHSPTVGHGMKDCLAQKNVVILTSCSGIMGLFSLYQQKMMY
jgi:hypothetical protein